MNPSRREFLTQSLFGLAALGAPSLLLSCSAQPTPASGSSAEKPPTPDNIEGPFFRDGAPFRGKVSPPLSPGVVMVIGGRVWSHDTKKPIPGAILDVWQASAAGRYDNDDPSAPPAKNVFLYRSRLQTDQNGYYEFETIHPGHYPLDRTRLRPAHIHFKVVARGHKWLTTQLYFRGDPHIEGDPFVKNELIIDLQKKTVGENAYELGVFDIVLAKI